MRIIVSPANPAISLEDIRDDLRVLQDDDDHMIQRMVDDASQWVEARTQSALLTQTREIDFLWFPARSFDLSLSRPVQSVVSIVYRDSLAAQQTIDPAGYYLQGDAIWPAQTWPSGSQITIRFVAGYTSAEEIPTPLRAAIRLKVMELYDGDDASAAINSLLTNFIMLVA